MRTIGVKPQLLKLEQSVRQPDEDAEAAAAHDLLTLCEDILDAIADGFIVDRRGELSGRCMSPTAAEGLQEPEYSHYFILLYHMEDAVSWWAEETGWRSPTTESWEWWRQYRANNCVEMTAVARDIIAYCEKTLYKPR